MVNVLQKDADLENYIVNDFISLKLVRRRLQTYTILYLGGKMFKSFNKNPIGVFVSIPDVPEKIITFGQDPNRYAKFPEAKEEFDAYCSIFKNWANNDYHVNYINHNLIFPALKRLAELNDPLALKAYPLQIKTVIKTGNIKVLNYLVLNNFMEEEKTTFFKAKKLENNLKEAFDIEDLQPYAFPILKLLLDLKVSWAEDYFAKNQDKIKQILIMELCHEEKEVRHRTAPYFVYFGPQFANKEYSQVIFELGVQEIIIDNLHLICDIAVDSFKRDKDNQTGLIIRNIIRDLVALDDEWGVSGKSYLVKDGPPDLEELVRTYLLSKKKEPVKYREALLPECEVEGLKDFMVMQQNLYTIPVQFSESIPSQAVDFKSFLAEYDDKPEEQKSFITYTIKDNHVNGLYIFFTDANVCDVCADTKTFDVCYDNCIYFCIPPSIGVFERLEELIIFDARDYTGYSITRSLVNHLPKTLSFLQNLKTLRIPESISMKMGSLESTLEKITRCGTKIYGPEMDQEKKEIEQAKHKEKLLNEFKSMYNLGLFDLLGKEIKFTMDLIYKLEEPTNQVYLYTCYKNWLDTNDTQHLLRLYDTLARSYPHNIDAWSMMIQSYVKHGMGDLAIKTLQHFLERDPQSKFIWNMLGTLFSMSRQHEQAFECYQKQLKVNPDLHETLVNLSLYYEEMGDKEKAIKYVKKYLSHHPVNKEGQEHLKRLQN